MDLIRAESMQELHFLYLIASGNNDSIYKVGISVDPNARLRQIQGTYNVPKAYIVETMDVRSRSEVLALEAALHARLEDRRVTRYGGREFFKLNQDDLAWLRNIYQDNSNDFAQANAYYGLELAAAELRSRAQELEMDRQKKISHNRRHGKTHDTKPSGDLKRYNELKEKLEKGHLGERFKLSSYSHPALDLSNKVQGKANDIITQRTSLNFLKVSAIGLISGALVCAAKGADPTISTAITGCIIGFLSGTISQAIRRNKEKQKVKLLVESEIDTHYPLMRDTTMTALIDLKKDKSFLVSDYGESASRLRNKQAVVPSVYLPSEDSIYSTFENKSYFPKVATAIAIGFTIGIGAGSNSLDSSGQKELEPLKIERSTQPKEERNPIQSTFSHSQGANEQRTGKELGRRQLLIVDDPNLIHKEFRADSSGTLDKYNGKVYRVTGIVDNKQDDYVKLDSQRLFGGAVYCYYLNNEQRQIATFLQRNQVISLQGRLELIPRSNKRLLVKALDCSLET